ncbi:MAG: class I SAM-dependent methyltransferase [Acidobacteria bacterium]|nr:class I SAM-dependent methyltransferase [Acidobacteriota bacterium]
MPAGSSQTWDPQRYARHARFVADLGEPLIELLAPRPGERVLDLGCGDGALTAKLAALGVNVVGVDAGADMVAAARTGGLDVRLMDAHALTFEREFDAVFSNAALHWMRHPDAVLEGIRRALKPGGRFVAEFGGAGNIASILAALMEVLRRRRLDGQAIMPWYFPTVEEYRRKLEAHGFTVDSIALIPRPTPLPGALADWLDTFAEDFLRVIPEAEREAAKAEVSAILRPKLCDPQGRWTIDYVRLRLAARI